MISSLRFRLLLLVLLAMLGVVAQTIYTYSEGVREARQAVGLRVLELARLAAANVEGVAEGTRQLLVTLAGVPAVRAEDPAACQAFLQDLLTHFSLYSGFAVINANGRLGCGAFQAGASELADRAAFRRAIEGRDFAVGGHAAGRIPGKAALAFGYPLIGGDGYVRGVVQAGVDLAWLSLVAAQARLPEGSTWTVVHRDSTVLARYPDPEQWVGRKLRGGRLVETALRGAEGTVESPGPDGQPQLYAFRPLGGAVGSDDLTVIVGVPLQEAVAGARRDLARDLALLGLIALIALIATALVGETLVMRPIGALLRATQRLSRGELDVRTGLRHDVGEVGRLAHALDEMAAALQSRQREAARAQEDLRKSHDELEARVVERTREISEGNERLRRELEERERVQNALRASDERFKTFMDNSPVVAFLKDLEGRYLYGNRRLGAMFRVAPEELPGKTDRDLMPADIARRVREQDLEVLTTNRSLELQRTVRMQDGADHTWTIFQFPVRDASGRLLIGGVAIDVTARERAEEGLRQANEELKRWVDELERRTREITLLSEMGDLLQSCQTPEEAYGVITMSAQQLFPDHSGTLCMYTSSKTVVESVSTWGDGPTGERVFDPEHCWALRRGQLHVVRKPESDLLCRHVPRPVSGPYLCVPLMAQGQALGMLHLAAEEQQAESADPVPEPTRKLATAAADQVALALANMRLRETLRYQAIRDPLTGLFNRRYMEESLEREIHRAARRHGSVGVVMLDLDRFKAFNDTFGHAAGDTLLREVGAFMRTHLRGEDIPCRYGGEEFTLILPDADLEHTRRRAEDLRQGARQLTVLHHGQVLAAITLSLGVAAFPEHGLSAEEILSAADAALYRAKSSGRDRVTVASAVV